MKRPKKKGTKEIAQVNPELQGMDISVNEFGEIVTNYSLEKLNTFLDKNVVDKKLVEKAEKDARDVKRKERQKMLDEKKKEREQRKKNKE